MSFWNPWLSSGQVECIINRRMGGQEVCGTTAKWTASPERLRRIRDPEEYLRFGTGSKYQRLYMFVSANKVWRKCSGSVK